MYESHWSLNRKPFEACCDVGFFYPTETHQAAMLKLRYAVENRRGAALVAGPPGSGKTLLASLLRMNLAENFAPFIHLVFPQMESNELLAYLAARLDPDAPTDAVHDIPHSLRRIETHLADNTQRGRHVVLVVDEAHLLESPRMLETLRLLQNIETAGRPCMTLLLLGQVGILPILDRTPQLDDRLAVKCLMHPLSLVESGEYVTHRLTVAGATDQIFSPDALRTIHHLSRGIPSRINRLCDLALLIGYADGHHTITPDHIESVSRELVAVVPE